MGLVFNAIERVELEQNALALVLRTRPLPAFRRVLGWCDPEPSIISFLLPERGQVGRYWTAMGDPVTLDLNPADTVIFPLQSPTGKWYKAARVACNVVEALQALGPCSQDYTLLGLGRAPFAALLQAHQGKAVIISAPSGGYLHMDQLSKTDWSFLTCILASQTGWRAAAGRYFRPMKPARR